MLFKTLFGVGKGEDDDASLQGGLRVSSVPDILSCSPIHNYTWEILPLSPQPRIKAYRFLRHWNLLGEDKGLNIDNIGEGCLRENVNIY